MIQKIILYSSALLFGFGIGAGVMEGYTNIGVTCFIISGIGFIIAKKLDKEDNIT